MEKNKLGIATINVLAFSTALSMASPDMAMAKANNNVSIGGVTINGKKYKVNNSTGPIFYTSNVNSTDINQQKTAKTGDGTLTVDPVSGAYIVKPVKGSDNLTPSKDDIENLNRIIHGSLPGLDSSEFTDVNMGGTES